MGFLMGSPFRLTLPHPAREGERRASLLKRRGVGEGKSELGQILTCPAKTVSFSASDEQ